MRFSRGLAAPLARGSSVPRRGEKKKKKSECKVNLGAEITILAFNRLFRHLTQRSNRLYLHSRSAESRSAGGVYRTAAAISAEDDEDEDEEEEEEE
ncbi:hypothetical protein PUN28_002276 [Cardiocondyla obscurior]|uniref:Uncharacterized protein n=1 Tax=Cardiocondyla obscurior TaxID=286306 RepID=A0AAW2GTI4_9HYME